MHPEDFLTTEQTGGTDTNSYSDRNTETESEGSSQNETNGIPATEVIKNSEKDDSILGIGGRN